MAAIKVEDVQGRSRLPSLVPGHLEEMWRLAPSSSICGPQGRAGQLGQGRFVGGPAQLLACLCLHICEAGMPLCALPASLGLSITQHSTRNTYHMTSL